MKRRLIPVLFALLLLFSCASVSAAPQYCHDFVLGDISELDYNGELFIGISNGKLVTSSDFTHWTSRPDLPDVERCYWMGGELIAFGPGVTLRSSDGVHFTQAENNLPVRINKSLCAGGRILAHVYDREQGIYGTYSTSDGVYWERIEGIPDGADMSYMNGQFAICSGGYMRGLYLSDDGVHFTWHDLPGGHLSPYACYYDGAYHIQAEGSPLTVLRSEDLVTWTPEPFDDLHQFPLSFGSVFYENGDHKLAYLADGSRMRYQDGGFRMEPSPLPDRGQWAYTYYLTEHGLIAVYGNQLFFLSDYETITTSHLCHTLSGLRYQDGYFYAYMVAYLYGGSSSCRCFRSRDGLIWESCDAPESSRPLEGTVNGVTLTSDYIPRGSAVQFPKPTAATLTYADGSTARVVYEYTSGDYVQVQAGEGLFLLSDSGGRDGSYLSADGITRFPFISGTFGGGLLLRREEGDVISIEREETFLPLVTPAIRVKLNGEFLSFMTPPVVTDEGLALIPVRFLFERAGGKVSWDAGVTTIAYGEHSISFTENSATATVDGIEHALPHPVSLINGKTLIPLRFFSEQLGFSVTYDAAYHIAELSTPAI